MRKVNKPLIIIDPGHGGRDAGAVNPKYKEKNLTLKISKYQYNRFNELGIKTAMTRDNDIYLLPKKRAMMVRNSGAKYCISNHINAGGGEGAEVIHSLSQDGKMAGLVLKEIKRAGQKIRNVYSKKLPGTTSQDYYFMHRDTGPVRTLIIEYCFIDNPDDLNRFFDRFELIAEAVVEAYTKYLNINI